ncbi:MAG: ribonuclease PH [Candidatus Thalassarchaeaceae archaeon]|jgi:ribonuclease PH|nr:ribonuclease PH [Candidatus Thalassarchaeaceae archaeon]MDP7313077.1 ribonuclease PH [Candidatus Thalassarchaeaceae archaeon]
MAKLKATEFETSRDNDEMREVEITLDFTPNALASVLYKQGDTVVLACCTKQNSLPRWFPRDANRGWIHAEYCLLPGSTDSRFQRERRGAKGRTYEIERLIARALRGAIDLEALGPVALTIDCDVLNADGGTRCASITAANIALRLAIRRLIASGDSLPQDLRPTQEQKKSGWSPPKLDDGAREAHERAILAHDIAAVSTGLVDGETYLDLDYILDSNADVDMNVVMTSDGRFIEVQSTGEESTYSRSELNALVDLAEAGLKDIHEIQAGALDGIE